MAKPRKTYGKRPVWQWLVFYLAVGFIIYGLLYFSGVINFGKNDSKYDKDYSTNASEYNYLE